MKQWQELRTLRRGTYPLQNRRNPKASRQNRPQTSPHDQEPLNWMLKSQSASPRAQNESRLLTLRVSPRNQAANRASSQAVAMTMIGIQYPAELAAMDQSTSCLSTLYRYFVEMKVAVKQLTIGFKDLSCWPTLRDGMKKRRYLGLRPTLASQCERGSNKYLPLNGRRGRLSRNCLYEKVSRAPLPRATNTCT